MKFIKTYENYIGSGDYALHDNDSGDPFWGNVGAGILPYAKATKRFCLNFRSAMVNEPHTWGIWGGKLDEGYEDDILKAAQREFYEETGYQGEMKLFSLYTYRTPNQSFEYHNFLGLIPGEFIPDLDWESEGYKWVTWNELLEINPKHFGLEALLKNDQTKIKQYI